VVAQGQGAFAERLIEAARAYGIPIVRDIPVAHALKELEIGEEIPEDLYEAVAEILRELQARAESEEP
jgi:type III secretion system FlhB-like substrate exporter